MNIKNIAISLALLAMPCAAYAWNIQDLLNKAGETVSGTDGPGIQDALGGIVGGLFSKSSLTVADLAGTWTVDSPAVCFQSDNFLQKAGGAAAAGVVETKLAPYYRQYGLTGSVLTIGKDGAFTLQLKNLALSGTVTARQQDGKSAAQGANFCFDFSKFGLTSIGKVDAYVTKSLGSLDIMFDASKLKTIIGVIASFSKMQIAQTAANLLDQYDGICVGFGLTPVR